MIKRRKPLIKGQKITTVNLSSTTQTPQTFITDNSPAIPSNQKMLSIVPTGGGTFTVLIKSADVQTGASTDDALLDLQSTSGALVISRMTFDQMNALDAAAGMIVFVTNEDTFYFYNGTKWAPLTGQEVINPFSGLDRDIAIFYGDTGQLIQDSNINVTEDTRIAGVTDPINPQDVATKHYTDTGDSNTLFEAENYTNSLLCMDPYDAHFKEIVNVGTPLGFFSAINKQYLENELERTLQERSNEVLPSGNIGIFTGSQTLTGSSVTITSDVRIAGVTDPINPQDVATKNYVDKNDDSVIAIPTDFHFQEITNVGNPEALYSAVNVDYLNTSVLPTIAQNLQSKIATTITTLEAYADTGDAHTLAEAEAYANNLLTTPNPDFHFQEIINVGNPEALHSAINIDYLNTAIMPQIEISIAKEAATTLNKTKNLLKSSQTTDFHFQELINVSNPEASYSAVNVDYLNTTVIPNIEKYVDEKTAFILTEAESYAKGMLHTKETTDFHFQELINIGNPEALYSAVNVDYLNTAVIPYMKEYVNEKTEEQPLPYLNTLPIDGAVNFEGYALTNVPSPINAEDAANKAYVDAGTGPSSLSTNFYFKEIKNVGTPQNTYSAATRDYVDRAIYQAMLTYKQSLVQNGTLVPTGTILSYGSATIPEGYILCDGTSYNGRLPQYGALYTIIGTAWGNTNGTTGYFNVPDLRGIFLRGNDPTGMRDLNYNSRVVLQTNGNFAGIGSYQVDVFGSHNHSASDGGHTHPFGVYSSTPNSPNPQTGSGSVYANITTGTGYAQVSVGYSGGIETRPKNVYVNYIIKL